MTPCDECWGTGTARCPLCHGDDDLIDGCPECDSSGSVECGNCDGSGSVDDEDEES